MRCHERVPRFQPTASSPRSIVLLLGMLGVNMGAAPPGQQAPPLPPLPVNNRQEGLVPVAPAAAAMRRPRCSPPRAHPVTEPTLPAVARQRSSPNGCWRQTMTTRWWRRSGTACRTPRWCRSRAPSTSSRSGRWSPTSARPRPASRTSRSSSLIRTIRSSRPSGRRSESKSSRRGSRRLGGWRSYPTDASW